MRNNLTRKKILKAAYEVFLQKGYNGARMQEIAEKAGVNKALLHYYFRTKEELYNEVSRIALSNFLPKAARVLEQDLDLFEKIRVFTSVYIDFLLENSFITLFVINESYKQDSIVLELYREVVGKNMHKFISVLQDQIDQLAEEGIIRPISALHLLVNMISMCAMPVVAAPLLREIQFKDNEDKFHQFIQQRKQLVPQFIINSLKLNKDE